MWSEAVSYNINMVTETVNRKEGTFLLERRRIGRE
jgi:hypothetical protein